MGGDGVAEMPFVHQKVAQALTSKRTEGKLPVPVDPDALRLVNQ